MSEIKFPLKGRDRDELLKEMDGFRKNDPAWREGKAWSLVYRASGDHNDFLKKAHGLYFSENGLNPMAFKSLKKFEHETVRMSLDLLNGDSNSVGVMTSGGTESLLLAVKTYRDLFRTKKKRSKQPEMIIPRSAHVAFHKAAHYFDIKLIFAPLDDQYRVDIKKVKKLINKNTMLLVGSAPSYPFGAIDPIEDLAKLALKQDIPLHVDACLGGFILPFIEKLGTELPTWDFRVPGVSSISADVHKYGYAAKGASVILYRSMKTMKHQFFVQESWPGGIFASPGILGTRPGGNIAAAWAALNVIGEEGYLEYTKSVMANTNKMKEGVQAMPELEILGSPLTSVFAYKSVDSSVNVFAVADFMEERNWFIDRQQHPECLHAMVNPLHEEEGIIDKYLTDLREAIDWVKQNQNKAFEGSAAMYGMVANVPLKGMIKKQVLGMMEEMYGPESKDMSFSAEKKADLSEKLGKAYLKAKKIITSK